MPCSNLEMVRAQLRVAWPLSECSLWLPLHPLVPYAIWGTCTFLNTPNNDTDLGCTGRNRCLDYQR